MAQTKKRKSSTSTRRKRTSKKKQKDTSLRFVVAIVFVIVIMLGLFQLGIVGIAIDSFFNYIFGLTRYLTYILLLLAIGFLAYNGKLPKSRRLTGSILFQISLLFIAQLYYQASNGAKGKREPVLSFVYQQYEHMTFPNFGGGLIGYHFVNILTPLISIIGVVLLTLILFTSSMILLLKKRHRDVTKLWLENSKTHAEKSYDKYHQYKLKRREERQQKLERKREQQEPKDVSDFQEVYDEDNSTNQDVPTIPIFGHQDEQTSTASNDAVTSPTPPTSKRLEHDRPKASIKKAEPTQAIEAEGTISEAGEVENQSYELPPLSLLDEPKKQQATSKSEVQQKGKLLETTLKNFGVNARVTQIRIGPAVTQYEVQPAQGVKVSRIVNLHSDIALALAAKDIRIEAPIPGKSAVGIEVPNDNIALVSLKEVLQEKFPAQNKLEVALGRDISGEPMTAELNKMPHLLVAGSTGSGKSVCINGIITSILLNAKPHEVKLMMIDPKW